MTSSIKDGLLKSYEQMEYQYNHRDELPGIASGFYGLDMMLSGFHKSELTILAARHSMGKTAFALNMVLNMIKVGTQVLFVSYEMNEKTITNRILIADSEVDMMRVKTGNMQRKDWDKYAGSMSDIVEKYNGSLDLLPSCGLTFKFLADEIRYFAENNPDGIVVIDYFQLIKLEEKSERIVELSSLACDIKRLAVELDIPIILLSQISRKCEERKDRRPQVMDLAECDALAQHCDNLIFLHREDYWEKTDEEYDTPIKKNYGKTEVIVNKQKNGPIGMIELLFQPNIVKFKNPIKMDVF